MSIVSSFEMPTDSGYITHITASEEFIYAIHGAFGNITSFTLHGTEAMSYEDPDKHIAFPVLAPGGLLFCNLFNDGDGTQDEIVALDAQTMQPRHRCGLSLLNDARGMAVGGEELFVCDKNNDRLQVFSLAGEHRRSITGEWKRPEELCFVKDRLYLVEESSYGEDEDDELINPLRGQRIFVLSLQGDILQVYTHPVVPAPGPFVDPLIFWDLCYFDGKLLASVRNGRSQFVGVLALGGC